MSMPVVLYIMCQKIIIYCQKQKLAYLRNGHGLAEEIMQEEPQLDDFMSSSEAPAAPMPTPVAQDMSLGDLVKARLADPKDPQKSIEEAIAEAMDPPKYPREDLPKEQPTQDDRPRPEQIEELPRYTLRQRFNDWRAARREWQVKRYQTEYEYDCLKKQVADKLTGYDDVIAYIEGLMHDWDAISAQDNIGDASTTSISNYDTIGG